MATDYLARGVIDFEVNAQGAIVGFSKVTSGAKSTEAAITGAAKSMAGSTDQAAKKIVSSYEEMNAAQKRYFTSLQNRSAVYGKSAADAAAIKGDALGISSTLTGPYIDALRRADMAQTSMGLSAKQMRSSLRLVPAQMTDIVTSIASGMPIWLIAIQQGGQLKDSFGGIIPTFKVLLSLITPIKLAIVGFAAAVGAAAYGFYAGRKEVNAYNDALVLTNKSIAVTSGQLTMMARAVSDATGASRGAAADTLAKMIAAGAGTDASELQRFTTVAIEMNRALGVSIGDTVKAYAELAKDPLKASEQLNESYKYLTSTTWLHIKALTEEGRAVEATRLAQNEYESAQKRMVAESNQNLGDIERLWKAVSDGVSKLIDSVKELGRQRPMEDVLRDAEARLDTLNRHPFWTRVGMIGSELARRLAGDYSNAPGGIDIGPGATANAEADVAAARENIRLANRMTATRSTHIQLQQEALRLTIEMSKVIDKGTQKAEKLADAMAKYNRLVKLRIQEGQPIDEAQQAKDRAAIRYAFRSTGSGSKGATDDSATRMIQAAKEAQAALMLELKYGEDLLTQERKLVEFKEHIAQLQEKKILTNADKSLLKNKEIVRSELEHAAALEHSLEMEKFINKVLDDRKKKMDDLTRYAEQLAEQLDIARESRLEQYGESLTGIGQGDVARRQIQEENRMIAESYRQITALNKKFGEERDTQQYIDSFNKIKGALAISLQDHKSYYDALEAARSNWANGANEALNNYLDKTGDIAGGMSKVWGNAFQNMEDALTEFLSTGKLDFKKFVDSILADINRMIVQQQITGPIARSLGLSGGPSGGGAQNGILGSFFSMMFGGGAGIGYGAAGAAAATNRVPDLAGNLVYAIAKGGAFGARGMEKFASGGIVSRPTPFGMVGGRTGVMGEAGYEGVLPLTRGPSGKLGVLAAGGGSNVTNISLVVHAKDAPSFLRAESQVQATLARAAQRGRRNL